ncbi:sigma-70 family RNA polymerase sigma factor [Microbacterium oxydans]|uniref:sigma-70 family RNA polymerase sigma factor n=1 Tax=Microbacterium oxydans TaxID=82380 RepID=UPI0036701121
MKDDDDTRRARNDDFASAANTGDREAAGKYLQENLPYLTSMARWLAGGTLDPDDLAADCIANLLTLWAEGRGPTTHPNAYLVRAMRNRLIDERRSPRSRVVGLSEQEEELPPGFLESREIDLHREIAFVRTALRSLPEDQQRVLTATVVDGRKPADLTGELNRSAAAIYSLSHRAKANLRRATLQTVLLEGAPEECRRAAEHLPATVGADPDEGGDVPGTHHQRSCPRCRERWSMFSGMATLGLLTLLVVGSTVVAPAPAQAVEQPAAHGVRGMVKKGRIRPALIAAIGAVVVAAVIVAIVVLSLRPATMDGAPAPSSTPTSVATAPSSGAIDDIGERFRIPSIGLDVPVGAVSEVDGQITPPGFDSVYLVRNRGVALNEAETGTVYIVTHSRPGPEAAPGDALVDLDRGASTVDRGALVEIGDRRYEVTDSSILPATDLPSDDALWEPVPRRLVIITSLQNPDGTPAVDNLVLVAQLVE